MDDCGARCGAGWHGDGAWRCRGPHFVRLNIVEAPSAKLMLTGRVSMGGRTGVGVREAGMETVYGAVGGRTLCG